MTDTHSGSCLCGNVRFQVRGQLRGVIACHCNQCRKQSGHYFAATNCPDDLLTVEGLDHLRWYQSSQSAKRGFCGTCGSALFWKDTSAASTSILAGAFDKPTGLRMERHIFCEFKGDYYEISDGLPQEL
ncbi:MAG: GFA family protein [Nitratireductor sp.]|nr:GFA family protein [Nitratireductor sp.]MCC0019750.1 GFA family protein [Nitratireductor sp.]